MANVIINDKHLTDIGNSLRKHLGETETKIEIVQRPKEVVKVSKTDNATSFEEYSGGYPNSSRKYNTVAIDGAASIGVKMAYQTENTNYDYVQVASGSLTSMPSGTTKYGGTTIKTVELTFENTDTITFYFYSDSGGNNYLGYYAEVYGYDSNGALMVSDEMEDIEVPYEVKREFLPSEMSVAIDSIDPKDMVNSWIADTEHYGITIWSNAGSGTLQNLTLPDGVEFEDIVYLSGLGAKTSSSDSGSTNNNFPYVYCPTLWNHTIDALPANTWAKDKKLYFCGGFGNSVYSSTHAPGPVYGITADNVFQDAFYYSGKYYMTLSPTTDGKSIAFTYMFKDTSSQTRAYALSKYAKAVMIYKKKSEV